MTASDDTETPMKLLLVDDDPSLRGITVANLRKVGYEVQAAADGQQGLQLALEFIPDIVVSDIMMPVMDGVELLGKIREEPSLKNSYVILLTARDRTTDVLEGFAATADDYITKPFKMPELVARVKAGARLQRALKRLRETNARLTEALHRNAELLGVAAHDMRSPINIITTYISLLGQDIIEADVIKEVCLRRAMGLARLVDNLLDITKIHAGMVNVEVEEVNLSMLVRETEKLFAPVAQQDAITLKCVILDKLVLFADRTRLAEILNILFDTAINLAKEGKRVDINLEKRGNEAAFSITCSGGGFDRISALAFEPLVGEEQLPDGYDWSTLLGLAIVKKVIDMMAGRVTAATDASGEGACFSFFLPAAPDDSLEKAVARVEQAATEQERWFAEASRGDALKNGA